MKNFKKFPSKKINDGIQYIAKFKNGYGASIVKHKYSYGNTSGLWELAVLKDDCITYKTPITNDVIGYLTESEIQNILNKISIL